MPEAAIKHVLGCQPRDGCVIGVNLGQADVAYLIVEVHCGNARLQHLLSTLWRRGPSDDPVAIPAFDPGRYLVLEATRRSMYTVQGPCSRTYCEMPSRMARPKAVEVSTIRAT